MHPLRITQVPLGGTILQTL